MRIGNRGHRAVHHRHSAELAGGKHRTFDMHMGIDKARQQKRRRCRGGFFNARDAAIGDVNGARKDALAKHVDNLAGGGSDSRFGRQNRTPFHKPWAQLEGTADFIEPPTASVGPRFNR